MFLGGSGTRVFCGGFEKHNFGILSFSHVFVLTHEIKITNIPQLCLRISLIINIGFLTLRSQLQSLIPQIIPILWSTVFFATMVLLRTLMAIFFFLYLPYWVSSSKDSIIDLLIQSENDKSKTFFSLSS